MKKVRTTARILLYAILLAAIVATWIAVTELEAPAPIIPGDEIDAFRVQVSDAARQLAEKRSNALSQLETLEEYPPGRMVSPRGVPGRTGFQAVKSRTGTALEERIGMTSQPAMASGQYDLPELGDALAEADSLYETRIAEQTASMESIYREAMIDRNDRYLKQLGYYALAAALRRDLIKYRLLNSLPLHEIKLALYEDESELLSEELATIRSAAVARAEESAAAVAGRYNELVAVLISEIAATLAEAPPAPEGPVMGSEILESLQQRISSLSPAYPPEGITLDPAPMPVVERSVWIEHERIGSSSFLEASESATE